ncbi:tRNA 2'-phosphotransferase 1-like [Amphiura filiformis]|uniref:tRNA 2'-phosphotransferase 1-like n=1 Tax=Amphiura filiformis TaxID=82378 RepID=UPI003B22782B
MAMAASSARQGSGKNDQDVRLSKKLTYVLRHQAVALGFEIDSGGYINVKDLLAHKIFKGYTLDDIKHVAASNDKQRFSLRNNTSTWLLQICANQGHSFELPDLELTPITDAAGYPTIIHGTYFKPWDVIQKRYSVLTSQGLKRMKRTHIHFAQGEPGEDGVISGMRASCQVMIFLNLQKALQDGLHFFLSKNGVVLSPGDANGIIHPKYFSQVLRVRPRQQIQFTVQDS